MFLLPFLPTLLKSPAGLKPFLLPYVVEDGERGPKSEGLSFSLKTEAEDDFREDFDRNDLNRGIFEQIELLCSFFLY